ncbi:hypothetical protein VNO80_06063 [Phaseolus coccineus]|uniref:Uncharacterized protein n=1 Tax=Phaseolus coccineus TaxID=3886 RepID=A0AAN9NGV1_PHACN
MLMVFLIATEKLLGVHPFDGSKILIVAANEVTGFQVSENHLPEILPGIYLLDQVRTIRKIEEPKSANQPVGDY